MGAGTSVKLVIPNEIRLVDLVHAASEKMAELAGFDADEALNLGLAVREAVINAMLHGNRNDPQSKVTLTLLRTADQLEARVRDHGNGFDPEVTPDPTDTGNRLRTSGRGLLLMQAFVDSVSFRQPRSGGTEVVLKKKIPVPATSKGDDDGNGRMEE